jgi:glycosyltransferase involved in cell wall biosynthesis
MRIAFDQQVFLLQEFGGISRYICSLSEALSRCPDVEARILAPLHFNGHLTQTPRQLVFGRRIPNVPKTFRLVQALSEYLADKALLRFNPDIVHETYYSKRSPAAIRARRVITVYDMIAERFPAEFPGIDFTAAKRASVLRADHVFCISRSTRRDLIDLFGVPENRTSVVYLGYDRLPVDGGGSGDRAILAGLPPFLLYVGKRDGYKNFKGVLRSFAASTRLKKFAIVCFGGGAFSNDEHELIGALGLEPERVVQIGGGDDVLANLYRHAVAFVYPSLYEGFGIPPLEAMSLDCPVLCSDRSSIPEVVGDAGEYFDPEDVDAMRVAIESVLDSPSRQDELKRKGRARCASFSWDRCARETLDTYRSLL